MTTFPDRASGIDSRAKSGRGFIPELIPETGNGSKEAKNNPGVL
jgi:hypothetical protein